MINGEVLSQIGLPKSEYFIWYDDTEYSMRLAEYGGIVNVNSAVLNHKTVLPSGENSGFFARMSWRTYYGHRNRLDAVKTHYGKLTELCILAEFVVFIICAYLMQLVPSKREQGRYVSAMLKDALRDGYRGRLGKNEKY
jgi:GT2 family glycosyltransferase